MRRTGGIALWLLLGLSTAAIGFLSFLGLSLSAGLHPELLDPSPRVGTRVLAWGKNVTVQETSRQSSNDIPASVKAAFVSFQDSRFYEYRLPFREIPMSIGMDIDSLVGTLHNYDPGIVLRFARNAMELDGIDFRIGKVRLVAPEVILGWQIDRSLSKDEILTRHLNTSYFGHGVFGVGAAARYYFKKDLADLELHEIALLVGLSKPGPSDPAAARLRREFVLHRLAEAGVISPEQAEAAQKKPSGIDPLGLGN